ncbi:peptidoglycan-binding protein [Luteimonas huabeiensis]|uniref:peptidoglycan-binding protein n=1 Tax=Luteimonas huabeiensis TaxID=1244513 RepID=UPI001362DB75|nr:peptidoglycan-binding protein [Luteimonas huabeiensis]
MTPQDSAAPTPTTYRIQQLGPPRGRDGSVLSTAGGVQMNEAVTGFDSLVSHHPGDNRAVRMAEGIVVDGKPGRVHGYIGGRLEEIEVPRRNLRGEFRDYGLGPDQVLLKKDFILSDPGLDPMSRQARSVDVPSPVAGVAGARRDGEGLVDILDRPGGEVIARFRHMRDIKVNPGDEVTYGQTLGTQSNVATGPIHVHMEMDTRYYQQFRHYVDDLASGRLPMEAEYREGVQPRPVVDDGTFRLGESSERIRDLQRVMDGEGYRAPGGQRLDQDGVYRPGMQGALLDFQRDHGVPQTGDVDPATLRFAPPARGRETAPGFKTAPGHPDHSDHRPGLPETLEPARNERGASLSRFGDPQLDRLAAALDTDDDVAISRVCAEIERSPQVRGRIEEGHEFLAAEQGLARQQQDAARQIEAAFARG